MRRHASLLALLLAAASCAASSGAQQVHLPRVTRATLANGMRVILMEYRRAPTVSMSLTFPGGDAQDPEGKAGAMSMMAGLLRKGTTTRTAQQLADEIEYLGADISSGSGSDRVTARVEMLSRDIDAGLDLLADVLRNPTFPADELERVRKLTLAGLQSLADDPGSIASRVATETAFAGHPYGRQETQRSIAAITGDDLIACYKATIVPNRAIVAVAGDFKTAEMLAALRKRFEDWPRSTEAAAAPLPKPAPSPRRIVLVDKPDDTQTHVVFTGPGVPRNSPARFPIAVADTILGGGFTSRLVEDIRIRQSLTYGIGSWFDKRLAGGRFEISTFTKVETTRRLIDSVDKLLKSAASAGLTAQELNKAKGYLAGQFAISAQTPEAIAALLVDAAFYGLPDDDLSTYLKRLDAVTLSDINRVAHRYFDPKGMSLVLVGPAAKVKPMLKGLGEVKVVPVADVTK